MKRCYFHLSTAWLVLLFSAMAMQAQNVSSPGTSPAQWRAKFNTGANTLHKNVYPGVDVIFSGSPDRITAQLIVQPGANLGAIRLDLAGAENAQIGPEVNARLAVEKLTMHLTPPSFPGTQRSEARN